MMNDDIILVFKKFITQSLYYCCRDLETPFHKNLPPPYPTPPEPKPH